MAKKLSIHEDILICKNVVKKLKNDATCINDTFPEEKQGQAYYFTFWHLYDAMSDMRELYEYELRKLGYKIPNDWEK